MSLCANDDIRKSVTGKLFRLMTNSSSTANSFNAGGKSMQSVKTLLTNALAKGASDIYYLPNPHGYLIRLRSDRVSDFRATGNADRSARD